MTGLKGIAVQDGRVRCEQEVGTARDVYDVPLPAVVTVKEGLNLPRYPSVPAKLRARRKPVESERAGARASRGSRWCELTVPPGRGRQAELLGEGPAAAPAVVDLFQQAGGGVMVLVFVEHADGELDELSLQALTLARGYAGGEPLAAVMLGPGAADAAPALGEHGVATVHVAALDGGFAPQAWARAVAELAGRLSPAAVVAAGSDRGNEILAHAAVMTGAALAANCVARDARRSGRGHAHALGRQPARAGAPARRVSSC